MRLYVYYDNVHVGTLSTTSGRGCVFSYTGNARVPISVSLGDLTREYTNDECLPFFSGLLPDGRIRDRIADLAHVSSSSTVRLLEQYGSDVAGALSILTEDDTLTATGSYQPLAEEEIARRLENMSAIPLLRAGRNIRLSLAGAENKIPLYIEDGRFFLPLGDAPSDTILKASDEFVQNEYVATRLASLCGIPVSDMRVREFSGKEVLLIKRYDRVKENGVLKRLHQEDFCQALGVMPEKKYEEEGGPAVADCLRLVTRYSSNPIADFNKFVKINVFNFIIGNCDAHGKNYSLLYDRSLSSCSLAPFYDIVSSTIDERFSRKLAMRLGHDKDIDRVTRTSFYNAFSRRTAVDDAISAVTGVFPRAASMLRKELPPAYIPMLDRIEQDAMPRLRKLII